MKGAKRYENVRLKMLCWAAQSHQTAVRKFASEFEAETGASIEFEALPAPGAYGWWALEPLAAYDAGSDHPQFDLFCDDNEHQHALWPHFLPLNDLMRKFDYQTSDFFPTVARYGERVGGQQGLRYGLPVRTRTPFVYYRTDLIGHLPGTWEELEKAFADNTGAGNYGFTAEVAYYPFHPFGLAHETAKSFLARYWSMGDPVFSPDWKPLIHSDKGVAAMEMLKRQISRYGPPGMSQTPDLMTWDGARALQEFLDGKIAVLELAGEGDISLVSRKLQDPTQSKVRDKWSIGLYPGSGAMPMTYHTMSIFKHSKHPEAAFEFIAHCTGAEGARRLHLEYGENSPRRSVMTSAEAIDRDPYVPGRVAALERAIPPTVPLAQWMDFQSALWEAVQFSFLGFLPVKTALTRAARKWSQLLEQAPPRWEYWESAGPGGPVLRQSGGRVI